jgi:hypothetical protein
MIMPFVGAGFFPPARNDDRLTRCGRGKPRPYVHMIMPS